MIMQVDWFLTRLTFNSWSITFHFVFAMSDSLLDSVTAGAGTSAPHGPSHPFAFSGLGTSRVGRATFILERIPNAISSIIAESESGFATDSTSCWTFAPFRPIIPLALRKIGTTLDFSVFTNAINALAISLPLPFCQSAGSRTGTPFGPLIPLTSQIWKSNQF